IDGIDEVLDSPQRAKVLNSVIQRVGDRKYRFLLASRDLAPVEFRSLGDMGFKRFEIQLLSEDDSIRLSSRWFAAFDESGSALQYVERFRAVISRGVLGHLARNPLIATAICASLASDPARDLPRSVAELYEDLADLLIEKQIAPRYVHERLHELLPEYSTEWRSAVDRVLQGIRPLTEFLAEGRRSQIADEPLVAYAQKFPACKLPARMGNLMWCSILAEILRRNGCLVQDGNDFSFIHSTVMEYLAACGIKNIPRPRWVRKMELAIRAGRGDSYALFVVSVLRRNDIDITRPIPKILNIRRVVHAQLIAALAGEGEELDERVVNWAERRLQKESSRQQQSRMAILYERIWGEDQRVSAGKSLALLDPAKGGDSLARSAVDFSVGNFSMYDWLSRAEIRNPATDSERILVIGRLVNMARDSHLEDLYRMMLIRSISELDPGQGIRTAETLARDPSLGDSHRMGCVTMLLELSPQLGAAALVDISADPRSHPSFRFQAIRRLQKMESDRAHESLER
ncbi:MAG: hypothetical protein J2P31_20765, partial [Blastocatellia bacterium]|nr:hypothetical protein [Blastocatellia bacterium]